MAPERKTCAIVQSSYLPWRGFFDLIRKADVFVFLDQVQFTRRDWRTRNRIVTANGPAWLSVPVKVTDSFSTKIIDVVIDNSQDWNVSHLKTIKQAYAKAKYREEVLSVIAPTLESPPEKLSELNRNLIKLLWDLFSGGAEKSFIGDESIVSDPALSANLRLIELCKKLNATHYISGPSAQAYMELETWARHGITVEFATYNYPAYPQLYGDFEPAVSIIDVLMNLGPGTMEQALMQTGGK